MSNQSSDSLQVECIEGFDGGLPQGFLLELVEMPTLRLVRNLSLLVSLNIEKKNHKFKLIFHSILNRTIILATE